MNKILAILLLSCGLVSCQSCSKKDSHTGTVPTTSNSVVVPPPPTSQVVKDVNFKFVAPADWTQQTNPLDTNIKVMFTNTEKEGLFIMATLPFLDSYNEYILTSIRELKDNGIEVLQSTPVIINGEDFIVIDTAKDTIRASIWLSLKNGIAYQFTCGSRSDDLKGLCTTIANSIELK